MNDQELRTRDGKLIKSIGSWEAEQLKKDTIQIPSSKGKQEKRKDEGMDFIYRIDNRKDRKPHWVVRITIDGMFICSKTFPDCKCGGTEFGLKLAIAYRDEQIKSRGLEGYQIGRRRTKK